MLRAIIVDNEQPAIDLLRSLLARTAGVEVLACFLSGDEALQAWPSLRPDVVFLDIELPEQNGLQLAASMRGLDQAVEIVFVTAYDRYALEAFGVQAAAYLLKPLRSGDVERILPRLKRCQGMAEGDQPARLTANVHCFGKLALYGPGSAQPVRWRTAKAEELFAFMLFNLGREVPKWQICEQIWPHLDGQRADIHLHTTVYKMKKTLADAGIDFTWRFRNSRYCLSLPEAQVDASEFQQLCESDLPSSGRLAAYEQAFALYQGRYLGEGTFSWALAAQEEYERKYLHLVSLLARHYLQRDQFAAAEEKLLRALQLCPLAESVHELLLKLYFISKERSSFLSHYRRMQDLLMQELGVSPKDSVRALYRSLLHA